MLAFVLKTALAVGFLALTATTPAAAAPVAMNFTESVSMQPTIREGDRFLTDRGYYDKNAPGRGDVVLYQHPTETRYNYIKRIVAVAGDRIALRAGRVILNGVAIEEPYAALGDGRDFYANMPETVVPVGHLFVLGDNRANSTDSRAANHGMVPVENLRGRATYIVWSRDLTRIGRFIGASKQ